MATLVAHDRVVSSPFGLVGGDENALSFALGYTLSQSPEFLREFLRAIGIIGVSAKDLRRADVRLQHRRSDPREAGITDIEILLGRHLHVIVEAKVGLDLPTIGQCLCYAPRLVNSNASHKRLVALVQSSDVSFIQNYKGESPVLRELLRGCNWSELLRLSVMLMGKTDASETSGRAIRWFYNFLDQDYRMKAFTTEVWILPVNTADPLWPGGWSYLDTHVKGKIYYDKQRSVRPLYIAFRANGKVEAIHRVNKIEHETPPINYLPILSNVRADWPRQPLTLWHLDDPVKLPQPIPSGGRLWQRRIQCDLDVLLSSKSVLEIEQLMGRRREASERCRKGADGSAHYA